MGRQDSTCPRARAPYMRGPGATIYHIHVVCSTGGNAIPFQKRECCLLGSVSDHRWGIFLDTEGPPSTPPAHSADGLASPAAPSEGKGGEELERSCDILEPLPGSGLRQSGLCRTYRLGLSGRQGPGPQWAGYTNSFLCPLQS